MTRFVVDRARCAQALEVLIERCEGVDAALLVLRDGRPFLEKGRADLDRGRMAAMASSLAGLGQSVLKELQKGMLDHVLIEGATGKLVVSVVPGTAERLLLAVSATADARLGLVLGQAKICCTEVALAMSHQ